jgi:hypothetical protein
MLNRLHSPHRSPDIAEPAALPLNVSVDANGTAVINLTAPSAPPEPKPAPDAAAPAPAGQRIEDVAAALRAQTLTGAPPTAEVATSPPAAGDSVATPVDVLVNTEEPAAALGPLVFEAPSRTADGTPVAITVQSQDELEALQRLQNGYARKEAVAVERAQLAQERAEQQAFTQRLEADPIGFIVDNLPSDVQVQVAEALLARLAPDHAQRFDVLLGDDGARREALLDAREKRTEWLRQSEEQREIVAYRDAIASRIDALIPETASNDDATQFFRNAKLILHDMVRSGATVAPESVASILAGEAKRFGFTSPAPSAPPNATGAKPAPTAAAPAAPIPTPVTPKPAIPLTPQQMLVRGAAAAVIPAGAGAVPSTHTAPPPGMRIEDAAAWFAKRGQMAS